MAEIQIFQVIMMNLVLWETVIDKIWIANMTMNGSIVVTAMMMAAQSWIRISSIDSSQYLEGCGVDLQKMKKNAVHVAIDLYLNSIPNSHRSHMDCQEC